MLRNSIFALSAFALLSVTALMPTEAFARFGGSHGFTSFHPVLHPPIVFAGVNPIILHPHPPCLICLHPPVWGGGGGGSVPPVRHPPHPGNGGYVAASGDIGGGSTSGDCDVVRKRTPSGKIVEICSNWAAE